MNESVTNKCDQEAAPRPKSNAPWGIAFAIGWSLLLFLILPFSVFPLGIRLTVTIVSFAAFYVLLRSLRGWHYLWTIPLILFWLVANYAVWTASKWSEEDNKKAFDEWSERIKKEEANQR